MLHNMIRLSLKPQDALFNEVRRRSGRHHSLMRMPLELGLRDRL